MTNERLNYSFDNEQHQFLNKYYKFDLNRILLFDNFTPPIVKIYCNDLKF